MIYDGGPDRSMAFSKRSPPTCYYRSVTCVRCIVFGCPREVLGEVVEWALRLWGERGWLDGCRFSRFPRDVLVATVVLLLSIFLRFWCLSFVSCVIDCCFFEMW